MRIFISTGIYPPDVGGPATYSKILFEELPKLGIAAEVLSFGAVRHLPPIIRHFTYFIKVLRWGRGADIIFAQDPMSVGLPAMFAAKILRKKFLLKIVGDYAWEQGTQRFSITETLDDFLDKKYGFMVEGFKLLERFVARRADKIIVPSEYLKKVVIKWGIDQEKIKVIYNAFDASGITLPAGSQAPSTPLILKGAARAKLSINQNDKIIVSAGRLVPWKGFAVLIEILPEILKIIPDAKLIIIGDGPNLESLKGQARAKFGDASEPPKRGLSARNLVRAGPVIFTGNLPRKKVLEYLAAADVFVLNTAYEGLSHQILEAMAVGCPVITTNVGGNPELISDGVSGLLINVNDKVALKSKIMEVLNDVCLAQTLAKNAKNKASEFTMEKMINDTINLIKNI